ncbi:uncharacterized protein BJ171DRAFT_505644, partial [Polychytrium aggregatum]|uniref:uncharacterized protein n=1 Tax=Polychytrium aggregatum TaxID=110093 RepID=UPI0022FE426F
MVVMVVMVVAVMVVVVLVLAGSERMCGVMEASVAALDPLGGLDRWIAFADDHLDDAAVVIQLSQARARKVAGNLKPCRHRLRHGVSCRGVLLGGKQERGQLCGAMLLARAGRVGACIAEALGHGR